jgi:hypothetical protein
MDERWGRLDVLIRYTSQRRTGLSIICSGPITVSNTVRIALVCAQALEEVVIPRGEIYVEPLGRHLVSVPLIKRVRKQVDQVPCCASRVRPWNSNPGLRGAIAEVHNDQVKLVS